MLETFNMQWAVTTSVDFSLAQMIQVIILLSTGGKNGGGYVASKYIVIALHGGILFLHATINSLPISILSFLGQLAAAWNLLGMKKLFALSNLIAQIEMVVMIFRCCGFDDFNPIGCYRESQCQVCVHSLQFRKWGWYQQQTLYFCSGTLNEPVYPYRV